MSVRALVGDIFDGAVAHVGLTLREDGEVVVRYFGDVSAFAGRVDGERLKEVLRRLQAGE